MKTPLPMPYEAVLNLIRKNAHAIHRIGGDEIEELVSQASLAYLTACETYDKARGAFTTHLSHCVSNELLRNLRKKLRRALLIRRVDADMTRIPGRGESTWNLEEFLETLSDDALEAVAVAGELAEREATDYRKRLVVLKRLREMKWDRDRISAVFMEVNEALKEARK